MPLYTYACALCKKEYVIKHSVRESLDDMFQVRAILFLELDVCTCDSSVELVLRTPAISSASLAEAERNRHKVENVLSETRDELDMYKEQIKRERDE